MKQRRWLAPMAFITFVLGLGGLNLTRAQGQGNSFYVTIGGTRQGEFKGDNQKGQMVGLKFSMQEASSRNSTTGESGKRQDSLVTFTKLWAPSDPQLLDALNTNEVLSTVTFEFVSRGADGRETINDTIVLTNATVSSLRRYIDVPTGNEAPDPRKLEDISFTYQRIEFKYQGGSTTSSSTPNDGWTNGGQDRSGATVANNPLGNNSLSGRPSTITTPPQNAAHIDSRSESASNNVHAVTQGTLDLSVAQPDVHFSPVPPRAGQATTFTALIRNLGTAGTQGARVIFRLIADGRLVATSSPESFDIAAHGTFEATWTTPMPAGRQMRLVVTTSSNGDVNPRNNEAVVSFTLP